MKKQILSVLCAVFVILFCLIVTNIAALEVVDHPLTKSIVLIGDIIAGGMGTGFIVTDDGYIVTANHVVDAKSTGTIVVFPDPLMYRTCRVVYSDPLHDIAVLKAEIANFEIVPVKVGKLSDSKIGDEVLVLGHPQGIGWLLARGIISSVKYDRDGFAYIFSDVATAPGSSGSPIFNMNYEVIGIVQEGVTGLGCIGIAAERLVVLVTAAIEADHALMKNRIELEQLQEKARREWKRIIETISDAQN
jgi:S1-C subfamily serine protease